MRVTAAHIAGAASAGYGPKIIRAALLDRLIPRVFVLVQQCWLIVIYQGQRWYLHLPLHMVPYTLRLRRVPLLVPVTFRMELPERLLKPRTRGPRKPAA